jgi:glycine C-acetyltransferase
LNINKSKPFIYTSALPSIFVKHSLKRFEMDRKKYQKRLEENVKSIRVGLEKIGYGIYSKTHIIPLVIGDEKTAMRFGDFLFKNGIYAQPIRFPTVPKNSARIRISVTGWLSKKEIRDSLIVFEKAYAKYIK